MRPSHVVANRRAHKPLVNKAFRALRSQGFVAKQRFMCCQGCALSEPELSEAPGPYVFYHQQDAEYFETGRGGKLMIRYGQQKGDTRAVARKVVAALKAAGVPCAWNGQTDRCIEVDLDALAGAQS
jgi:hypothetical protein